MSIRRIGRNGIVAIACVASCLVVKYSGAADAKREKDGDELNSLRKAVLARFDSNHNGRLDSKEKAKAYKELLSRDETDDDLTAVREQVLDKFDKNGNGKLERSEVRSALIAVNSQAKANSYEQSSGKCKAKDRTYTAKQVAAAVSQDPSAAVAFTAQQLKSNGYDTVSAEALAIDKFDLNGDGVLDQNELVIAQAQTLQQLAALTNSATTITTPIVLSSTGTTTTGTTSTGTTSTGSSSTGMAGGCSGSGSGSGSTGTSGSSTSTGSGTTNSAANAARFGNLSGNTNIANFRAGGFGGRRGR